MQEDENRPGIFPAKAGPSGDGRPPAPIMNLDVDPFRLMVPTYDVKQDPAVHAIGCFCLCCKR